MQSIRIIVLMVKDTFEHYLKFIENFTSKWNKKKESKTIKSNRIEYRPQVTKLVGGVFFLFRNFLENCMFKIRQFSHAKIYPNYSHVCTTSHNTAKQIHKIITF